MKISLVVADGHQLFREGLVALLQHLPDLEVRGQACDGLELLCRVREHQPDVLLLDPVLPKLSGLEAMRRLRTEPLPTRMLCVAADDDPDQMLAAMNAGAHGYLLKCDSPEGLVHAIRKVHANQPHYCSELMREYMRRSGTPAPEAKSPLHCLTQRERQIIQLFAEGYSTQEIADQLHLSTKTVATHREHIFEKLKLRNVVELTRFALRVGISSLYFGRSYSHADY
ncbi:MAG: LuxR C-terminal-related transcriptional regulator [Leptothrix sp. (in: b-proteobacteria)]